MHQDLINTPYLRKILTYFKKWFGTPIASVKCYGGHFLNSHLKSHLIIKIQYKMENINFSHNWNSKLISVMDKCLPYPDHHPYLSARASLAHASNVVEKSQIQPQRAIGRGWQNRQVFPSDLLRRW